MFECRFDDDYQVNRTYVTIQYILCFLSNKISLLRSEKML